MATDESAIPWPEDSREGKRKALFDAVAANPITEEDFRRAFPDAEEVTGTWEDLFGEGWVDWDTYIRMQDVN